MYESHWSLHARPFDNRFAPEFFYPSGAHQAARLKLHYAIEMRRSVAVLCGEPGMGKSMLMESCIDQLPESFSPIIRVPYPAMPPEQLVRYIARQIVPHEAIETGWDISSAIEAIERFLKHNLNDGNHALLVIEEAHLLDATGAMEPLRLLLNLASELSVEESAMSICLVGNIPLVGQLSRYPAFEDRVAVRCVLERFSLDSTTAYISHRLRVAGWQSELMFDSEALETIQQLTCGVPRRINRLCDLCLMIGYAQDNRQLHASHVQVAHGELSARVAAA